MPDDRTESLRIRVSPAEKKAMQDRAEAANVTVSELVREALLGRSDLAIASAAGARREGQRKVDAAAEVALAVTAPRSPEEQLDWMREQRERNLAQEN